MNKLIFLGTGAGDQGMITQKVKTSSIYMEFDGLKFLIDPGPGTIVNANNKKINLLKIDGILITHPHPDHIGDANTLIDALRKKGSFLVANQKCLIESQSYFPCINKYQQIVPGKTYAVQPGNEVKIKKVKFEIIPNNHLDCGMGIKIIGTKKIGYVGDGCIDGIEKYYQDMDLLIFNVLVPYNKIKMKGIHTNVNEVIEFLKKTKPKKAIIQHFSLEMLKEGIKKQAEIIEKQTKVKTIAAKDGMEIKI